MLGFRSTESVRSFSAQWGRALHLTSPGIVCYISPRKLGT